MQLEPVVKGLIRSSSGRLLRLGLLASIACNRTQHSAPPSDSSAEAARAAPAAVARHPGGPRVVAIGDLHGDLPATRAALRLVGAIDASDRWTGGSLVVVQTGDQLDRGDTERGIVDLFEQLAAEARGTGGAVLALNGNHETMNVQGDFRYVTEAGLRAFDGVSPASPLATNFPVSERQRGRAFLPGGAYALKLSRRDLIAVVADSVFAHAGVLSEHVEYGVDRINQEVRAWMTGATRSVPAVVTRENAPVWTRLYGGPSPDPASCRELEDVLSKLQARRMVVGHTIQRGGISSACGGKLHRIDVGMSRHYGKNPIQALEIAAGRVRILSSTREALLGSSSEAEQPGEGLRP